MIIKIITWNLCGTNPKNILNLKKLIFNNESEIKENPDIIVFNFQEVIPLNIKNIFSKNNNIEWNKLILNEINNYYEKIIDINLFGLSILIYCKKNIKDKIDKIVSDTISTGIFNIIYNKCAIGVKIIIKKESYSFINVHLSKDNYYTRIKQMDDIISKFSLNILNESDNIFFTGDFNYKINLSNNEIYDYLIKEDINKLYKYDEIFYLKKNYPIYNQFNESEIKFLPTYKYYVNSQKINLKKTPAFCDRIFYLNNKIRCIYYNSIQDYYYSDHKPVIGIYYI